jgi:hypothetical protein
MADLQTSLVNSWTLAHHEMPTWYDVLLNTADVSHMIAALEAGSEILDSHGVEDRKPLWRDAVVWSILAVTGRNSESFKQIVRQFASPNTFSQLVKSMQDILQGLGRFCEAIARWD